MKQCKILVIVPAYNEQGNILNTLADIRDHAPQVDYVVINDCSTDQTREILTREGANVVHLPVNLGIGGGVQTGYCYALENGYDIAIQFDGDGQHMAAYLQDLITPIVEGEADVTIGSRFIKKEGFQSRKGMEKGFCHGKVTEPFFRDVFTLRRGGRNRRGTVRTAGGNLRCRCAERPDTDGYRTDPCSAR